MFNFNNKRKGYGSVGVPGFNNSKKRGTISNGDWDRDGVRNRKDCEPLNFRMQDGGSDNLSIIMDENKMHPELKEFIRDAKQKSWKKQNKAKGDAFLRRIEKAADEREAAKRRKR